MRYVRNSVQIYAVRIAWPDVQYVAGSIGGKSRKQSECGGQNK